MKERISYDYFDVSQTYLAWVQKGKKIILGPTPRRPCYTKEEAREHLRSYLMKRNTQAMRL